MDTHTLVLLVILAALLTSIFVLRAARSWGRQADVWAKTKPYRGRSKDHDLNDHFHGL